MKIRFTPEALVELDRLLSYLAENSPSGAHKVQGRLKLLLSRIARYPMIGQPTDIPDMRRIVASPSPYVLFYRTLNEEIQVIAIRHGARDPNSMPDANKDA